MCTHARNSVYLSKIEYSSCHQEFVSQSMSENVTELSSLVRINLQQPFPGSYKPSRNPYPFFSAENGSGSFLYAICHLRKTVGAAIFSNGMYKLSDVMDT